MKKSFMYLMTMMMVAMLSVGFASCSSDDDEGNGGISSKELVGDWEIVGGDEWAMSDIGTVYSFYEDGTCEWGSYGPYTHWRLSGSKLYMTRDDGRVEQYICEFKNNQLHLTFPDGDATEYTILEKITDVD